MVKAEHADISKIAIIGTEGAGKTVFVTVWSKLLEKQEEGRPFIIPDPTTYTYIEKNWSKLRNGQWPESTPQSEFVHLFWRLKLPSGQLCQINVCDVAGHDIRRLFTGNKPQANDDPTKAIYDTVVAASIVLVIINLQDFITTTESQRIDNCANLLSMLQFMFDQKKEVALVFSQWHEYEGWVDSHGSVEAVLSTYMSSVYNTCCLEDEFDYFKVAAVVETTSRVEGGVTITDPALNFGSLGFSSLNDWIMEVVERKSTVRPFLNPFMKTLLIIGGWLGSALFLSLSVLCLKFFYEDSREIVFYLCDLFFISTIMFAFWFLVKTNYGWFRQVISALICLSLAWCGIGVLFDGTTPFCLRISMSLFFWLPGVFWVWRRPVKKTR